MLSEGSSGKWTQGTPLKAIPLALLINPEFSWTDSSRRDAAFCQEETAEGSSRPEGEQDKNEASSSNQVEWSYTHSTSTFTGQDAVRLVGRYGMVIVVPQELGRVHKPPKGYVMASETFLKFGVCFLLHQFFKDILYFYGLMVFQVTPNVWALCPICRAKDGSPYPRGVLVVLHPESQQG